MKKFIADKKKLANKVLKLRKDLNMTEKLFSESIDIDSIVLNQIELGEYNGNVTQLIQKICKTTNTEESFFKGLLPEKKKKTVSKPIITEKYEYKPRNTNRLEELSLDYSFEEISKFPHKDFVFYENINNTLELKNKAKTRICAYCGNKASIENLTPEHVIYKCDCQDFIDNTNEVEELSRKHSTLIRAKLDNYYEEHIKRDDVHKLTQEEYKLAVMLLCLKLRKKTDL